MSKSDFQVLHILTRFLLCPQTAVHLPKMNLAILIPEWLPFYAVVKGWRFSYETPSLPLSELDVLAYGELLFPEEGPLRHNNKIIA